MRCSYRTRSPGSGPISTFSVITAWDLGMRHLKGGVAVPDRRSANCIGVDYIEGRGQALARYTDLLGVKAKAGGFRYKAHLLPHDVEVRELATGHSRRHELVGSLLAEPVITVPNHSTEDGIGATRAALGVSWFDEEACRRRLARLRSYRRGKSGQAIAG